MYVCMYIYIYIYIYIRGVMKHELIPKIFRTASLVRYEFMLHYTPNIYIYIYIYIPFLGPLKNGPNRAL